MTELQFLSSIFLGLVQGIAEFLPISSSGHLALFQHFFGLSDPEKAVFFNVLLHLGTLVAIFIYYWTSIVDLLKEFGRLVASLFSKEKRKNLKELSPDGRMILMILVATLPLFLVYPIKDFLEGLSGKPVVVGIALLITGTLLFFSDRMAKGKKTARSASVLDALLVGVGQAIAVVPGLSRSGTSISVGMLRGFKRKFAVRFSFLLSIPAVLGANILSIGDAVREGIDVALLPGYIVGTVVAAVIGYFAIRFVNRLADKGKFGSFCYYCWGIGGAAILATLIFH